MIFLKEVYKEERENHHLCSTLRKHKFPAGRPFDVVRNFRNKV